MSDYQPSPTLDTEFGESDDGQDDSSEESSGSKDNVFKSRLKEPQAGGKLLISFQETADPGQNLRWGFIRLQSVQRIVSNLPQDQFHSLGLQAALSIPFPEPQLINALLLARRRIRDVHGRLAFAVKNYVEGLQQYDWAQLTVDCLSQEVWFLRTHILHRKRSRTFLTFAGQLLTWLFMHKGLIPAPLPAEQQPQPAPPSVTKLNIVSAQAELENLRTELQQAKEAADSIKSDISAKDVEIVQLQKSLHNFQTFRKPLLISPDAARCKFLILGLEGILCNIATTEADMETARKLNWPVLHHKDGWIVPHTGLKFFIDKVLAMFTVLIWSTRTRESTMSILAELEKQDFLLTDVST
ncbi:hypothetical protein R1sor_015830 [Riccia sorocarpa]|uniref:Uncharacterized protein n=1 Tax=Riccia sorocarpa TaxID=122646 RepID=A0ABD3HF51_9MARC